MARQGKDLHTNKRGIVCDQQTIQLDRSMYTIYLTTLFRKTRQGRKNQERLGQKIFWQASENQTFPLIFWRKCWIF